MSDDQPFNAKSQHLFNYLSTLLFLAGIKRTVYDYFGMYLGPPMVCGWIWFSSNELRVFYPRAVAKGKIFFLSHVTSFLSLHKCPYVISTVLRSNQLWRHSSGIAKLIPWMISTAYEGKHVLKGSLSKFKQSYRTNPCQVWYVAPGDEMYN